MTDEQAHRLRSLVSSWLPPDTDIATTAVARGILTQTQREEAEQELLERRKSDARAGLATVLNRRGWLPGREYLRLLRVHAPGEASGFSETATPGGLQTGETAHTARGSHLPSPRMVGRYRIIREVGRGGMGVVFEAEDVGLRRRVALKVLQDASPDHRMIRRLRREAAAAGRLRHPHIVQIHDIGEADGCHYIAMEFVEGESFGRCMSREALLRDRLARLKQVAEALGVAHAAGVVHRDVKPGNILIDRTGAPRLCDFGLARLEGDFTRLTRSGAALGTPAYMAPEQCLGQDGQVGPPTDVWALGVILYETLTGIQPFARSEIFAVYQRIIDEEPVAPSRCAPEVPWEIEAICLKALSKDPRSRYADAREMAEDLGRWLNGEAVRARPVGLWTRTFRKARKHRLGLLGVVSALLIAGVVTGAFVRQWHQERRAAAGAQEMLRKAGLVSAVLGRWSLVQDAVERLERWGSASNLAAEDRRERLESAWASIQKFIEDTPPDATSQATMKALAGWAHFLAGRPREGTEWMESATREDPDVPYGALCRAMVHSWQLLELRLLPMIMTSATEGFQSSPPHAESKVEGRVRSQVERFIAEAKRAPIWGQEGAGACLSALDGIRAMQAGDYVGAEAAYSRAIPAIELRMARGTLLLARAKSRLLLKDLDGAIEDLNAVVARRPESARALSYRGLVEHAMGADDASAGRDPSHLLERAIATFSEALKLDPHLVDGFVGRSNARHTLATYLGHRGVDPRPLLEACVLDCTEAFALSPQFVPVLLNRALASTELAEAISQRGGDPSRNLRQAISDAEAALLIDPDDPIAYGHLGLARIRLGEALQARGDEALPHFEQAIKDLDNSIRLAPGMSGSWFHRGMAHYLRGVTLMSKGSDPTEAFDRALVEFHQTLALRPSYTQAHHGMGMVWMSKGRWEEAHDSDPATSLHRAVEAFGKAIQATPLHAHSSSCRGLARTFLASVTPPGLAKSSLLEDAIADLTEAIQTNPNGVGAYLNRAIAYRELADVEDSAQGAPLATYEKALADLDMMLRLSPNAFEGLYERGMTRLALGDARNTRGLDSSDCAVKARADFLEITRRYPKLWRAWAGFGYCLESTHGLAEAVAAYEKAVSLGGEADAGLRTTLDRVRSANAREERDMPDWVRTGRRALALLECGEAGAAHPLLEAAIREAGDGTPESPTSRMVLARAIYDLACFYALASIGRGPSGGESCPVDEAEVARLRDQAFSLLNRLPDLGWQDRSWLAQDSDLLPLHDDPRWPTLLENLRPR